MGAINFQSGNSDYQRLNDNQLTADCEKLKKPIPTELIFQILSFLPIKDLLKLRQVDKEFKQISEYEVLARGKLSPDIILFLENNSYEHINTLAKRFFQFENKALKPDFNFLRCLSDDTLKTFIEDENCPQEIKSTLNSSPTLYFKSVKEDLEKNIDKSLCHYAASIPKISEKFIQNLVEFLKYHSIFEFQENYKFRINSEELLIILSLNRLVEDAQNLFVILNKESIHTQLECIASLNINTIFYDSPDNYLKIISKVNQPMYSLLLKTNINLLKKMTKNNPDKWNEILDKNPVFEKLIYSDYTSKRVFNENDENLFNFENISSNNYLHNFIDIINSRFPIAEGEDLNEEEEELLMILEDIYLEKILKYKK